MFKKNTGSSVIKDAVMGKKINFHLKALFKRLRIPKNYDELLNMLKDLAKDVENLCEEFCRNDSIDDYVLGSSILLGKQIKSIKL